MEQKAATRRFGVVFDAQTGEIVHTHHIVTLLGAPEPADEEVMTEALHFAGMQAHAKGLRLDVLLVDQSPADWRGPQRVDLIQRRLVVDDQSQIPDRDKPRQATT